MTTLSGDIHEISWAIGSHEFGNVKYSKLHKTELGSDKTQCGVTIPYDTDYHVNHSGRCQKCFKRNARHE